MIGNLLPDQVAILYIMVHQQTVWIIYKIESTTISKFYNNILFTLDLLSIIIRNGLIHMCQILLSQ